MEQLIRIPDYEVARELGESPQSSVYLGFHRDDPNTPLAIKVLKIGALTDLQDVHFRQKIEHLKVLTDPAALRPLAFETAHGVQLITRQFFEGIPLDEWLMAQETVSLRDFFTLSSQLANTLARVHEAGITHGGVKPHNILVEPKSLSIGLVDFLTALDVREVSHFIYDVAFVKNTLAYTSPEQTGRINHRVDFTTDLYSLGIILYELLTGRLPFFSLDPLALIHSHLAEEAQPVHQLNPEVPEVIGRIIAKLILKQPEKRYQSGTGLLADLERCYREYLETKEVAPFALGLFDFSYRVRFVSRMVGRDEKAKIILDEHRRAAGGSFASLFISGLPGIGKTRLIQELQRSIVMHRGYFTSGKFDIYQRNIPYGALIQSFRTLMRTLLTESDERVEVWKKKILAAVGRNGRVLTGVIPELGLLIGQQPELDPLPPVESRNRFNDVMSAFLMCLASKEHPLALFIDDLQWCDSATFDFLGDVFARADDYNYLFLLGAYRHNEVDQAHPLSKLMKEVKENGRPLKEVRLGPLAPEHCHEMVSYILDSPLDKTAGLAAFITDLSDGNPLFVSEVLSYLHAEELLQVDEQRVWQWDLARIRETDMPPTVVALFAAKIKKLPLKTFDLLKYCACMGNRFLPTEVAAAREMELLDTFETLKSALAQGLLMESKENLQFVHDRVQEAVLTEIRPALKRRIHWEVGTHLLSRMPEGADLERFDNLFQIVAHLNLGRPKKLDEDTAYRLSHLNLKAGDKALKALATEAANDYFRKARELLPEDSWDKEYDHTFDVYRKAAKTEIMCGNYESSEELLAVLLANAVTDLDRAQALAEQTTSLSSVGNFIRAIDTANRGLTYFDEAIPDDPDEAERRREKLMGEIDGLDLDVWQTILTMPFTVERKSKIELAFYSELIPDLYMSGFVPQLYLSAAQSTRHCLAGGMDESVIYSFSIMGLCLGEQGLFEEAFKYEDLAHELCAKYPNTFGATRGINGVVWCNMHSRSTPAEIIAYCQKGIQSGRNSGDLYNAGLCYGPLMWNQQVQGRDLSEIEVTARECLEFSTKYRLNFSVRLAEAMQAGWIEPMKNGYEPVPMVEKLAIWEKENHVASAGSYFVHLGLAHYYLGEHEHAEEYLQAVKRYLRGLTDNVLKREWHIFLVLNALRLHELGLGYRTRDEILAYTAPLIDQVKQWVGLGPLLKPYCGFLEAELERVTGNSDLAAGLYLRAIGTARGHRYTFLEGYLNERFGEVLEEQSLSGSGFLREARRLYRECRAERKLSDLEGRHGDLLKAETMAAGREEAETAAAAEPPTFDVRYLWKSATAIASEIDEKRLISEIMRVVLEASSADRGYLIMKEDPGLVVRAESRAGSEEVEAQEGVTLDSCPGIYPPIVRFVDRTGERIVLANASAEGPFHTNPEVQKLGLTSVLCLPIVKQSKTIGLLYLENRLAEDVFTPDKTEMTELLTTQAAISLENARLIDEMKAAEGEIKRSLREKEALLQEVHHRVKNNLQIIHSILNLQTPYVRDEQAVEIFKETKNRVYSMALIHDMLYRSASLADIDLPAYVQGLMSNLFTSFGVNEDVIGLRTEVEDIALDVDTLIPCALIMNELVSNSLKHAFDPGHKGPRGEIYVRLGRADHDGFILSVRDNGKGLPPDFDPRACDSLGLKLVGTLLRELRGTMAIDGSHGTEFRIVFSKES